MLKKVDSIENNVYVKDDEKTEAGVDLKILSFPGPRQERVLFRLLGDRLFHQIAKDMSEGNMPLLDSWSII